MKLVVEKRFLLKRHVKVLRKVICELFWLVNEVGNFLLE